MRRGEDLYMRSSDLTPGFELRKKSEESGYHLLLGRRGIIGACERKRSSQNAEERWSEEYPPSCFF